MDIIDKILSISMPETQVIWLQKYDYKALIPPGNYQSRLFSWCVKSNAQRCCNGRTKELKTILMKISYFWQKRLNRFIKINIHAMYQPNCYFNH